MSATATFVKRELDASGDSIKGFKDAALQVVQAMVLDPEVSAGVLTPFATDGTGVVAVLVNATARSVFRAEVNVIVAAPADTWLMVFDKATAPVATDIPILRRKVADGFAVLDLGAFGQELALGLGVALSITPDTLTLAGANDAFFQGAWSA